MVVLVQACGPPLPVVTEPGIEGQIVSGADVHMATREPDDDASVRCTDWEIWLEAPPELAWHARCAEGTGRWHVHLGDGMFVGAHTGRDSLLPDHGFALRVRQQSAFGAGAWVERRFVTERQLVSAGTTWIAPPGFVVEEFAAGFQLPVNIAFSPTQGGAGTPFFYVTELYGTIKVVTRDGEVRDYATGLLNFDPTGPFPGSGEQGLTGIVVEPETGDVLVSLLYDAGGPHYPRIVRLFSHDGGLSAAGEQVILDMAGESQGQSHQISNLSFGPDGKLYVHLGDGFVPSTATDLESFRGKILRLEKNGSPAVDNPFHDAADGITARDYVFAYGFRNPFGGAWRSATGEHYVVENGPSIDRFLRADAGESYGWNGTDASMIIGARLLWQPAVAPVNLVFLEEALLFGTGFAPSSLGHAFLSEAGPTWATGPQERGKRISELELDATGAVVSSPKTFVAYGGAGKSTVCALAVGPHGLYFSELYAESELSNPTARGSRIFRVRYTGEP